MIFAGGSLGVVAFLDVLGAKESEARGSPPLSINLRFDPLKWHIL